MATALPSLALHCLGPPAVRVDGQDAPPDVAWKKHLALLVYLALSPDGTRSRNHLMGLFWAERFSFPAATARAEQFEVLTLSVGVRVRRLDGRWRLGG